MNSSVSIGELAALSLNLPNDYHSKSVLQKGQKPIKVGNVVEHQPWKGHTLPTVYDTVNRLKTLPYTDCRMDSTIWWSMVSFWLTLHWNSDPCIQTPIPTFKHQSLHWNTNHYIGPPITTLEHQPLHVIRYVPMQWFVIQYTPGALAAAFEWSGNSITCYSQPFQIPTDCAPFLPLISFGIVHFPFQ